MPVQNIHRKCYHADLSLLNLMRLGCISPEIVEGGGFVGNRNLSFYKGTESVHLLSLGLSLELATREPELQETD